MDLKKGKDDTSHNEIIISQFTKQATPFAQMSQHSNQYGLEKMLRLSKPQNDYSVLDVACGPGIVACEFAKSVSHVIGIDLTPAMIEQAKLLQKEKNLKNIEWKIGDVLNLPFEDNSFSMVVTRYSLHHMIDPKKVLMEMHRVCKVGGQVLVIDVTPDKNKRDAYDHVEKLRDTSHTKALTFDELKNMMANIGLDNIETDYHDLEMELENILRSSQTSPGNINKIKHLFKEDVVKASLGMKSHLINDKIYFYFPISMLIGIKK